MATKSIFVFLCDGPACQKTTEDPAGDWWAVIKLDRATHDDTEPGGKNFHSCSVQCAKGLVETLAELAGCSAKSAG
jgi:hypothetical protein